MQSRFSRVCGFVVIWLCCWCSAFAQSPQFIPFSVAQPVLNENLGSLPAELKPAGRPTAAAWDAWVRHKDKEVRTRIERGEEDTLTNLLRLGVTYTKQPRISFPDLERMGKDKYVRETADHRADDLIRALAAPHANQGMSDMRTFLEKQGFNLNTPEGRKKVKAYMLANLERMRDEVIRTHRELYKPGADLSQQFKDRGISTDTNLYPDYMIEQHLRHMMQQGLLQPGSVHRVAIVGPGLDFVNKNSGSDFYPPQSTQPFAVIDTLKRLQLADPASVEVYTFDISSRVNKHLARARAAAAQGKWYTMQLLASPSDQWSKDYAAGFNEYWQKLGDQVGKPAPRIPVPEAASDIWNRAVSVRPEVVLRVFPEDMNVVFQTLPLPPGKKFDLVIGTNIFVYYDSLQQALARASLATMIKPGGFLLSNDALAGSAATKLADSLKTDVSTNTANTEHVYSYVREK